MQCVLTFHGDISELALGDPLGQPKTANSYVEEK